MLALQNNARGELRAAGAERQRSSRSPPTAPSSTCRSSLGEQRAADGTPAGIDGVHRVCYRPVRSAERRGAGGAAGPAAGGRGRRPRARRSGGSTFCRRGARTHPAGVERHRAADRARHPAGAVCRPGGAHARCGRGGVRGRERSATASSMPAPTSWRITCAALGVGPEVVVGLCVERSLGDGGRAARHPQGRRRLSAARSRLPGRAARLHARGRRRRRCWSPQSALLDRCPHMAPAIVRLDADWPAIARQPAHAPPIGLAREHRLRHLHLRLDRNPKGRGGQRMAAFPIWRQRRSSASPLTAGAARSAVRLAELSMPRSRSWPRS